MRLKVDLAGGASGGTSGTGGAASTVSGFIKIDPMDGLEIGFGAGEQGTGTAGDNGKTDDHSTVYVTYVYGPLTAGYQQSNVDTVGSTADDEQTRWALLYAVNDEMSISYQSHENDDTTATDEDADRLVSILHFWWYDFQSSQKYC